MKKKLHLQEKELNELKKSINNQGTPIKQPLILPKIQHKAIQKNTEDRIIIPRTKSYQSYSRNRQRSIKAASLKTKSLKSVYRSHRSNQYEQSKPLKMPAKCRHPQSKFIGSFWDYDNL